jgi:hypothetical protein
VQLFLLSRYTGYGYSQRFTFGLQFLCGPESHLDLDRRKRLRQLVAEIDDFRKSFKLAPGIRMSVTPKGVGVTAGPRGTKLSVHSSGRPTGTTCR